MLIRRARRSDRTGIGGRSPNVPPEVSAVVALEAPFNPTVEYASLEFGSGVGQTQRTVVSLAAVHETRLSGRDLCDVPT
ncbi:hypothetical protein C496_07448 [Natronorubrum tibetense GA33]|uniref:Uncharacterized protein n=1 Tax=Natronorubrum tibetense GA33 TaxID=1114856 RepID=L9VYD8_9EURY|nr:hypothetical protein C496_07448 [Natronorubrum tibetense GA33]